MFVSCLITCGTACGQGEEWPFRAWELKVTDGLMNARQLLLRMPTVMVHVIDDDSPLADWRTGRAAVAADSDSEFVIVVYPRDAPMQLLASLCLLLARLPCIEPCTVGRQWLGRLCALHPWLLLCGGGQRCRSTASQRMTAG